MGLLKFRRRPLTKGAQPRGAPSEPGTALADLARAENFIRAGESNDARRSRMSGFVVPAQHRNGHGEVVAAA